MCDSINFYFRKAVEFKRISPLISYNVFHTNNVTAGLKTPVESVATNNCTQNHL